MTMTMIEGWIDGWRNWRKVILILNNSQILLTLSHYLTYFCIILLSTSFLNKSTNNISNVVTSFKSSFKQWISFPWVLILIYSFSVVWMRSTTQPGLWTYRLIWLVGDWSRDKVIDGIHAPSCCCCCCCDCAVVIVNMTEDLLLLSLLLWW